MPSSTIIDLSCSEQEHLLFELRRARFGYWLTLHILLLCAAGYTPTPIAAVLFCSRSSVYRAVRAYRDGALDHLTGRVIARLGERKTAGLFLELLEGLDREYPAASYQRLYVAVDNFGIGEFEPSWLSIPNPLLI